MYSVSAKPEQIITSKKSTENNLTALVISVIKHKMSRNFTKMPYQNDYFTVKIKKWRAIKMISCA